MCAGRDSYISIQLKAIASSLSVLTNTTMEAEVFPGTSFFSKPGKGAKFSSTLPVNVPVSAAKA